MPFPADWQFCFPVRSNKKKKTPEIDQMRKMLVLNLENLEKLDALL